MENHSESVISPLGGFATSQFATKIGSFLKHKRLKRLVKLWWQVSAVTK